MPFPPLLAQEAAFPLQIFIHSSDDVFDILDAVHLRRLSVWLRARTTSRISSSSRVDRASWPIWDVKGDLVIDRNKVEVDINCGMWQACKAPGTLPPSFDSCSISQEYAVEVIAGLSSQLTKELQV